MGYPIESKPAPKSVWFTPQEARNYYGRYARSGITIHWWGDGTGANNHDNIVNFFLRRKDGSVNYVLSDRKITQMVAPDNVAWTSQSGNATTISIEHQPTLGAEGYKKSGWLVAMLENKYKRRLTLYPHKYWFSTACPGSIDINRIRREADKWHSGAYDPKPAPTPKPVPKPTPIPPKPPTVNLKIVDIPNKKVKLVRDTNLWDLHFAKYPDAKAVKKLVKNTIIDVSAKAYHPLGSEYYLTDYSYTKGISNGINVKDCEDIKAPIPAPSAATQPPITTTVKIPAEVPKSEPVNSVPVPVIDYPKESYNILNKLMEIVKKIAQKIGINI